MTATCALSQKKGSSAIIQPVNILKQGCRKEFWTPWAAHTTPCWGFLILGAPGDFGPLPAEARKDVIQKELLNKWAQNGTGEWVHVLQAPEPRWKPARRLNWKEAGMQPRRSGKVRTSGAPRFPTDSSTTFLLLWELSSVCRHCLAQISLVRVSCRAFDLWRTFVRWPEHVETLYLMAGRQNMTECKYKNMLQVWTHTDFCGTTN